MFILCESQQSLFETVFLLKNVCVIGFSRNKKSEPSLAHTSERRKEDRKERESSSLDRGVGGTLGAREASEFGRQAECASATRIVERFVRKRVRMNTPHHFAVLIEHFDRFVQTDIAFASKTLYITKIHDDFSCWSDACSSCRT